MDHQIVVRRHDLAGARLRWIPRRRYVSTGPLENGERVDFSAEVTPHWIRTRNVATQRAMRCRIGIELERDVVGIESLRAQRHERGQRMIAYELTDDVVTRLDKVRG